MYPDDGRFVVRRAAVSGVADGVRAAAAAGLVGVAGGEVERDPVKSDIGHGPSRRGITVHASGTEGHGG